MPFAPDLECGRNRARARAYDGQWRVLAQPVSCREERGCRRGQWDVPLARHTHSLTVESPRRLRVHQHFLSTPRACIPDPTAMTCRPIRIRCRSTQKQLSHSMSPRQLLDTYPTPASLTQHHARTLRYWVRPRGAGCLQHGLQHECTHEAFVALAQVLLSRCCWKELTSSVGLRSVLISSLRKDGVGRRVATSIQSRLRIRSTTPGCCRCARVERTRLIDTSPKRLLPPSARAVSR